MSTNLITVSGTLAKHELRYTPKGTPVLEVALVGRRQVGENFYFSRTDLNFFGKRAETLATALQTGQAYQAMGHLQYEAWETEGVKASRVRVLGEELYHLEQADIRQEEKGPVLYGAENRVILSGGLTADAEVRQTAQQTLLATTSLGFTSWDHSTSTPKNHYLDLEAWREVAAQFVGLKKGSKLMVEGALKLESWDDKETNTKRYKQVLVVQKVTKLGWVKAASEQPSLPKGSTLPTELPF